ncbi:hypothetical protein, partial [Pseudomonas aeruginosa]|uniref:hypothetical protein n=1 Tax=Pseudomonas aeruginosa TaxID=287 RepID=UPI00345972BC
QEQHGGYGLRRPVAGAGVRRGGSAPSVLGFDVAAGRLVLLADRSSRDRYLLASLVDAECMTDPHTRSAIYQAQTNRSTTCN